MRRIFSSILVLATGAVLFPACQKGEVIQDPASLGRGSYVTLVKSTNTLLDVGNLANSTVSIDVQEFGLEQEKLTIYVAPGTPTRDKTKWKKIKEIPNTNGGLYTVAVKGSEIATAIAPTLVAPGNQYTIYNSVTTKDGAIFDFANTSPTLAGNANYNAALAWGAIAVCPFTGIGTNVNYRVVQDDWVDWSPGDVIKVSDGPRANSVDLRNLWPNPAYGSPASPFIVDVVQNTGAATTPTGVTIANNYPGTFSTLAGTNGYVFTCTGLIDIRFRMAYNGSDQGFLRVILQKQ
jgi:hypothetical protein